MTPLTHERPRVRMIIPVWGMDYVERWLALSFASLRSEGNIPYVNEHCDFELAIVTKSTDATLMRADVRFNKMMNGLRVKFVSMDEFFPPHGQVNYGMPLTLAYAKGIADLGAEGLGSFVILMNADFILSTGSLKSVVDSIKQGFAIVTAPSIRVIDAEARPILIGHVDTAAGVLAMSSREMMRIVNMHLHNTVRARTVNEPSYIDSTYYHTIYWRISPDCLAARYFLLMPLCFRVDRQMNKVICPVDYGFITEICPEGRFTALADSDDMVMLELQERDSQAYLLRIAPRKATIEERLALLEGEIASQAAGWATAEHRRSVTRTLYFHERDLPADIAGQVAPFNDFMEHLLARMPPAVSHIRHFHWLGGVRDYRERMVRGGAGGVIELLEDPRNGVRPTLEELGTRTVWSGGPMRRLLRYIMEEAMLRSAGVRGWGRHIGKKLVAPVPQRRFGSGIALKLQALERRATRRILIAKPRRELENVLAALLAAVPGRNAVAYLFDMEAYAPPPPAGAPVLRFPTPYVPLKDGGFRLKLEPPDLAGIAEGTLLIYAPLNFVPHWVRIADDVSSVLQRYQQVIFVLLLPQYESARIADYSWLLSLLLGFFGSASFGISIDTVRGRVQRDPVRVLLGALSPRFWLRAPRLLGSAIGGLLRQALSYRSTNADEGPSRFAGLMIRMTRRP